MKYRDILRKIDPIEFFPTTLAAACIAIVAWTGYRGEVEVARSLRNYIYSTADENKDKILDDQELIALGKGMGVVDDQNVTTPQQIETAINSMSRRQLDEHLSREVKRHIRQAEIYLDASRAALRGE